jgi:hypothetical protein
MDLLAHHVGLYWGFFFVATFHYFAQFFLEKLGKTSFLV